MIRPQRKVSTFFRVISAVQSVVLTTFLVIPPNVVQAQTFNVLNLPEPGSLVNVSAAFVPVLIKGISLHPENPLVFDFIVDPGNTGYGDEQIREEGQRLIKYFLAALTVPEKDLWVNLSPYEKDRIIPTAFGQTEMGRDLLAQDYILKQISASMIYPERDLGKDFWGRVYQKAKEAYGTVKIPVSTFNKVWIVPDRAVIVENNQTAFVAKGHLKVMLEEDYAALNEKRAGEILGNKNIKEQDLKKINNISSSVVREIILPEIEKEVNEGKNFAQLRQIYYSLVLAAWFKNNLKDNILTQVYADQKKISGVDIEDKNAKEQIYDRYMEAYRQGVFNYIREDVDTATQESIPRKYFSGGADYTKINQSIASRPVSTSADIQVLQQRGEIAPNALSTVNPNESFKVLTAGLNRTRAANDAQFMRDAAMLSDKGERTAVSLEPMLSRTQSEAVRLQTVQAAAPILREALKSEKPEVRESAQRTITSLSPISQSAAGFTTNEITSAREGAIAQLNNPATNLAAAYALKSGGISNERAEQVIAQPLKFAAQPSSARSAISVAEMSFNQMTPTQQMEAVKLAATELRSNDADSRASAERIVTFAPKEIVAQSGISQTQVASAVTNVQAQLDRPETAVPAAFALRAAGIENVKAATIVAQPMNAIAMPQQVARPTTIRQVESLEMMLSTPQMPEVQRTQAITAMAPTLKTALNDTNAQPEVREAAERTVVSMTPQEQKAAGLTQQDVETAERGTLAQMERQDNPQVQTAAARAIVASNVQTPTGEQKTPATTVAREIISRQTTAMAQPTVVEQPRAQVGSNELRSFETAFNAMPVADRTQAAVTAAPAIKTALKSNDVQSRESAERAVTQMTGEQQQAAGFTSEEVSGALRGTLRQMGDTTQPQTQMAAARTIAVSNNQTPIGEQKVPAATFAREVISAPVTAQATVTLPKEAIGSIETVYRQMPEAQQVAALRDVVLPALNSSNANDRESAQRMVASTSTGVATQAGVSQTQIASAVTSVQGQLERPETAVPAAYALKAAGIENVKASEVIAQPLNAMQFNANTAVPSTQSIKNAEPVFMQMPVTNQVETLKAITPALAYGNAEQQDTVQRMIAAAPKDVARQAGLSEAEIAKAVSSTQGQLERPETAVQAAIALNNGGYKAPKNDDVLSRALAQAKDLGGIDFDPALIKMEVNKENGGIKVSFDPAVLEEIRSQGINGFSPVILNVQPMKTALPLLTQSTVTEQAVQLTKL